MYAHTEKNVSDYQKAVDKSFEKIARSIKHDDIDKKLKGKASSAGFIRLT